VARMKKKIIMRLWYCSGGQMWRRAVSGPRALVLGPLSKTLNPEFLPVSMNVKWLYVALEKNIDVTDGESGSHQNSETHTGNCQRIHKSSGFTISALILIVSVWIHDEIHTVLWLVALTERPNPFGLSKKVKKRRSRVEAYIYDKQRSRIRRLRKSTVTTNLIISVIFLECVDVTLVTWRLFSCPPWRGILLCCSPQGLFTCFPC